jgi:hypothetical protein
MVVVAVPGGGDAGAGCRILHTMPARVFLRTSLQHRRAVSCVMCGKMFFPASLKHHQKACAEKNAFVALPCPFCDVPFPYVVLA